MFELIAAGSYWVLTALWVGILWLYLANLRQLKKEQKAVAALLLILAIDAFRTVFEGVYFGLYFNSLYGVLPISIFGILSQPSWLVVPKIINIAAAVLVLILLLENWLPRELKQRQAWMEELQNTKRDAELKNIELEQQAAQFEAIFNGIPDGIVLTDEERRIVLCNEGMKKTFGYTIEDLAGHKTSVLYESEEEFERQGRLRYNMSATEKADPYEVRYRHRDGHVFVGETLGTAVRSAEGEVLGFIGLMRDISDRKQDEERLKLAASVFTHAREGIVITDHNAVILEVNDTFCEITGFGHEEVRGQNARILKSGRQSEKFYASMWEAISENGFWAGEIWNRRKDGSSYAELLTISSIADEQGRSKNYLGLFTDITQLKESQQRLEHLAHYDALTGLPNRVLLTDRLNQAIYRCDRQQLSVAIAYLDLDHFKRVNDDYDHEFGDQVLIQISSRMKSALRSTDTLARMGGDEFVAVLVDVKDRLDCDIFLSRLMRAATEPVVIGDKTINVSTSIGVTFYPGDAADADGLLRHADQSMYIAKQMGRNRCQYFDVDQDAIFNNRQAKIERIKTALDHEEFVLYYQPKVNMRTGEVIGAEALIRWQHPEHGIVPPGEFLPFIENNDISIDLGEWVIATALVQMAEWRCSGVDLPISVNLGARQLQSGSFVRSLSALIDRHAGVSPCRLEIEIVETSTVEDFEKVAEILQKCVDIGVSFALDDFGTGYSSLTYLRRLPVNVLKIDQSFVRDMLIDPNDRAIVAGIIALAVSFNRSVVAEGVETIAHGTQLVAMGCLLAQGYGIARPMPSEEFLEWLRTWKPPANWVQ